MLLHHSLLDKKKNSAKHVCTIGYTKSVGVNWISTILSYLELRYSYFDATVDIWLFEVYILQNILNPKIICFLLLLSFPLKRNGQNFESLDFWSQSTILITGQTANHPIAWLGILAGGKSRSPRNFYPRHIQQESKTLTHNPWITNPIIYQGRILAYFSVIWSNIHTSVLIMYTNVTSIC